MRVLFATVPWPTHFYGFVPLAWALQLAGHEVRVACQPSSMDAVATCGLSAVRVGRDVDFMQTFQDVAEKMFAGRDLTPEEGERVTTDIIRRFVGTSEAMVDDVVRVGRAWRPDLIGYEPTAYAAPVAAAVLGVPSVRVPWGPDIQHLTANLEVPALRGMLGRFGLDTVDTLGTLTVDPCPPSMQLDSPVTRRTMRYVPFNGPGAMPISLLEPVRHPRVCLTWGTSTTRLGGPSTFLLPHAVRAATELGVEVVVAVGKEQVPLLGELAEQVRVVHGVPLHALLPTCDAIVHQGGAGTTLTAAACGVPQVIIPQLADQAVNAARLADTGAGLVCWRRGLRGDALRPLIRASLNELLGDRDRYAGAAARLREEIEAQPTPADTVPVLAELAERGVPLLSGRLEARR
jgi:UDP:flavonoid glycosyltransferase YjiC (YdhE family)